MAAGNMIPRVVVNEERALFVIAPARRPTWSRSDEAREATVVGEESPGRIIACSDSSIIFYLRKYSKYPPFIDGSSHVPH